MKDIPLFTTAGGLASLTLSQIPKSGNAWGQIHQYLPDNLNFMIYDICSFLLDCGAKRIFINVENSKIAGAVSAYQTITMKYEQSNEIPLSCSASRIHIIKASPITAATWHNIYRRCFSNVLHNRPLTLQEVETRSQTGFLYIAIFNGIPIGCGEIGGGELRVAAILPEFQQKGFGSEFIRQLIEMSEATTLLLETTSENSAALRLYQSMNFREVHREHWYLFENIYAAEPQNSNMRRMNH